MTGKPGMQEIVNDREAGHANPWAAKSQTWLSN